MTGGGTHSPPRVGVAHHLVWLARWRSQVGFGYLSRHGEVVKRSGHKLFNVAQLSGGRIVAAVDPHNPSDHCYLRGRPTDLVAPASVGRVGSGQAFGQAVAVGDQADIAARAPLRAVFRDTSFARDADRINAEQLFRQLSPGTELKAI